jgi:hypothetical protein
MVPVTRPVSLNGEFFAKKSMVTCRTMSAIGKPLGLLAFSARLRRPVATQDAV